MKDSNFGLLISNDITSDSICTRVFNIIKDNTCELLPKCFSTNEPITKKFDINNLDKACSNWGVINEGVGFLWKGGKPESLGYVAFNRKLGHSTLNMEFNSKKIKYDRLVKLFFQLLEISSIDYAYLHSFSDVEFDEEEYDNLMPYRIGVTTRDLERGIPNICWLNAFGKPYIKLFGAEKLMSSPVYKAHKISDDLIVLQLTEDVEEIKVNYKSLVSKRAEVKKYLGMEYFGNARIVPKFKLMGSESDESPQKFQNKATKTKR